MIGIIFVRLATHVRFYVGTLDFQIQLFGSANPLNLSQPLKVTRYLVEE
jgi:hypothetical protein